MPKNLKSASLQIGCLKILSQSFEFLSTLWGFVEKIIYFVLVGLTINLCFANQLDAIFNSLFAVSITSDLHLRNNYCHLSHRLRTYVTRISCQGKGYLRKSRKKEGLRWNPGRSLTSVPSELSACSRAHRFQRLRTRINLLRIHIYCCTDILLMIIKLD